MFHLEKVCGTDTYAGPDADARLPDAANHRLTGRQDQGFAVANIAAIVAELRARGAAFEASETPKTVDGVAEMPAGMAAWLKDPDGNLIGMIELHQPA